MLNLCVYQVARVSPAVRAEHGHCAALCCMGERLARGRGACGSYCLSGSSTGR